MGRLCPSILSGFLGLDEQFGLCSGPFHEGTLPTHVYLLYEPCGILMCIILAMGIGCWRNHHCHHHAFVLSGHF